jgi:hypothetical protein
MKFILEFGTGNECFEGRREEEIACILETIAGRFRNCAESNSVLARGSVMDRNGNRIGEFRQHFID